MRICIFILPRRGVASNDDIPTRAEGAGGGGGVACDTPARRARFARAPRQRALRARASPNPLKLVRRFH